VKDDDLRDEAEASDEVRSEEADEPMDVDDPDVPEADAIEQSQPLVPDAPSEPAIDADTPEADALEQGRSAGYEDDQDDRR
jgi:hypothetical protein